MATQKLTFRKVGNIVTPGDMVADITELETRDSAGNPANIFRVGEQINVHIHLIYPEELADVSAEYTVRLICVQLAPSVGSGPYDQTITDKLVSNTKEVDLSASFTASRVGTGPGVYLYVATFDFGEASDFGAYLYSNLFFVF